MTIDFFSGWKKFRDTEDLLHIDSSYEEGFKDGYRHAIGSEYNSGLDMTDKLVDVCNKSMEKALSYCDKLLERFDKNNTVTVKKMFARMRDIRSVYVVFIIPKDQLLHGQDINGYSEGRLFCKENNLNLLEDINSFHLDFGFLPDEGLNEKLLESDFSFSKTV